MGGAPESSRGKHSSGRRPCTSTRCPGCELFWSVLRFFGAGYALMSKRRAEEDCHANRVDDPSLDVFPCVFAGNSLDGGASCGCVAPPSGPDPQIASLADGVGDCNFGYRCSVSGTRGCPLHHDRERCCSACGEHFPVRFAERFDEMKSVSEQRRARILECNRPGSRCGIPCSWDRLSRQGGHPMAAERAGEIATVFDWLFPPWARCGFPGYA
jgi:hypothetical protein